MVIHHLTEYSLNGGEWLQAYADEEAGPGKTLTIPNLTAGTYNVRLRITPLTGGGPAVVSESVELVIEGGASVNQSQLKQVQDIQSALSFIASGTQVAAVQVSSALGSMLFSGNVAQSQTLQSELVSGGGIILGSSSQVQNVQANSVTSVLEYLASVASVQSAQSEAVNSMVEFLGDSVQTQSVQTESLSGEGVIIGTSAQSQAVQAANSTAILQFLGAVASAQAIQSESVAADHVIPITGDVIVNQGIQAEAGSAALVFYGTISESQVIQSRTANGLLSFVGNSVVNQVVQTRAGSGSLVFTGSASETQIKQAENISATAASAPSQPIISATGGDTQVIIDEATPGLSGGTTFDIRWGSVSGTRLGEINGVTLPYTHTERDNGTTYYYSAYAINANGTSAESDEVNAAAVAAAPVEIVANASDRDIVASSVVSFSELRSFPSGSAAGTSNTTLTISAEREYDEIDDDQVSIISRAFVDFTVTQGAEYISATLRLYVSSIYSASYQPKISVQEGNQAIPAGPLDFDSFPSAPGGTSFGLTSTITGEGFYDLTLGSAGLTYLNTIRSTGGAAKFVLREHGHDFLNVSPSDDTSWAVYVDSADGATESRRPRLVVV